MKRKPKDKFQEKQEDKEQHQASEQFPGYENLPELNKETEKILLSELEKTPEKNQSNALFLSGILLVITMMFVWIMEYFNYPEWMELLHPIIIFTEALIPFTLSFFLRNPRQSTILRIAGIIVLFTYLFALF